MRRFLCAALAALMLLSLAACGQDDPGTESTDDVTAAVTQQASATAEPTEEPAKGCHDVVSLDFINTFDRTPSMEEQPVYDKDGLTLTAKSLEYDPVDGPTIMLSVRNDTDRDLLIQNDYTTVNGYMIKPDVDIQIRPGKKSEAPMSISYLGLAMADIHSLSEVEFSLRILDSKTYEVIGTTPPVKLTLTGTQPPAKPDTSGQLAYDADGVRVILRGIKHDTMFESDSVLMVYMENNTDKTISVQNSKLTVNGCDITATMGTVLLPHKRAVDKIDLFNSDLDEHGIASLDSVDVTFEINDYEEWKPIAKTDSVALEPLMIVPASEIPAGEEKAEEAATAPTE